MGNVRPAAQVLTDGAECCDFFDEQRWVCEVGGRFWDEVADHVGDGGAGGEDPADEAIVFRVGRVAALRDERYRLDLLAVGEERKC